MKTVICWKNLHVVRLDTLEDKVIKGFRLKKVACPVCGCRTFMGVPK